MEDIFYFMEKVSAILGIALASLAFACLAIALEQPSYENMVWGVVEESIALPDNIGERSITVTYTVDDEEYTGTYRSTFHSDFYCEAGDAILLAANNTYSRVLPHTEKINDWNETRTTVLSVASVSVVFSLVGGGAFLLFKFLNSNISFEFEVDNLTASIRDVRRIANRCKNRPYRKTLLEISKTMKLRVKQLRMEERLVSRSTSRMVDDRRKALQGTFDQICTMASTTAIQMTRNSSTDELQKAIYQLQAYLEL